MQTLRKEQIDMENNDWYTQYQEYQRNNQSGGSYAQPKPKK